MVSVLAGALFLGVAELTVLRRLFTAPRVILLVATIGLAQLAQAAMFALPEPSAQDNRNDLSDAVGTRIRVVRHTDRRWRAALVRCLSGSCDPPWRCGCAIRHGAARSVPPQPSLTVPVWRVSTLAPCRQSSGPSLVRSPGMVAVLQEAGSSRAFLLSSPGPSLMTRVLVVAVIASFISFPRAVVSGILLGVVEALVRLNYPLDLGRFEALLLVLAIAGVFVTTRRATSDERESFSFAPRLRPIPPALRDLWWVRHHTRILGTLAVLVAIAVPLFVTTASRTFRYSEILLMALAALSLVVLVGWSGQISLGQGAFAGLGALITAALVNGNDIGIGALGFDWTLPLPELHFLWALFWATAATALVAVLIGLGALRVRGLLLAVVTLALAVSAEKFFFRTPFLSGGSTSSALLERASIGPFELKPQRTYYYLALLALVLGSSLSPGSGPVGSAAESLPCARTPMPLQPPRCGPRVPS